MLVVVLAVVVAVVVIARVTGASPPLPGEERCVARAGGNSAAVDLDQAHYASIIVGLSVKRELPPRAGSIALATVYQETGIRNLDYGDRDSVGLFQQRPSQGWGTADQLQDPYYATGKFFDALVKIDGWQNADITTIAQKIQISAHPDAYRQHEQDARVLASDLSGETAAQFTCLVRGGASGQASQLRDALEKTLGVRTTGSGRTVSVRAADGDTAWAVAAFSVANAKRYGVTVVVTDGRSWTTDELNLPTWVKSSDPNRSKDPRVVTITVR